VLLLGILAMFTGGIVVRHVRDRHTPPPAP
jgi:hypothetical protein